MSIRKTIQAGNSVIRAKAQKVKLPLDKTIQRTVTDLIDTMRAGSLIGIAAPQIGKSMRVFAVEVRKNNSRNAALVPLQIFINPEIVETSKKQVSDWEGCGSVANSNLFAKVMRPEKVTVRAFDQNGEKFELESSYLLLIFGNLTLDGNSYIQGCFKIIDKALVEGPAKIYYTNLASLSEM